MSMEKHEKYFGLQLYIFLKCCEKGRTHQWFPCGFRSSWVFLALFQVHLELKKGYLR